ncbi:MAG: C40 family peptidase [Dysgonamonadaceae bacterium]|jgi:hypothetical protein|nr:C40 family peptidase [Dysgonamonadaceae bacterium]
MTKFFKLKIGLVFIGLITLISSSSKTYIEEDIPFETVSIIGLGDIMLGSNYPSNKDLLINNSEDSLKNTKEIERLTKLDFPEIPLLFLHLPDSSSLDVELDTLAGKIIEFSKQYLGFPYRRGSKGPNNFDCSGFTHYVYKHFGYELGASCRAQINDGEKIDKEQLKPGDLIFFKGRNSKSKYTGHVGIVVSNDQYGKIEFIHASTNKGIKIEELDKSEYYKSRYITGLRIIKEETKL